MHAYMPDWQERERRLRKQAATVRGERRDNWNPNLGDAVTMQEKVDAGLKLLSPAPTRNPDARTARKPTTEGSLRPVPGDWRRGQTD